MRRRCGCAKSRCCNCSPDIGKVIRLLWALGAATGRCCAAADRFLGRGWSRCKGGHKCSECCCGFCFSCFCFQCCDSCFCNSCCGGCATIVVTLAVVIADVTPGVAAVAVRVRHRACGGYCGLLDRLNDSESAKRARSTCRNWWRESCAWSVALLCCLAILLRVPLVLGILWRPLASNFLERARFASLAVLFGCCVCCLPDPLEVRSQAQEIAAARRSGISGGSLPGPCRSEPPSPRDAESEGQAVPIHYPAIGRVYFSRGRKDFSAHLLSLRFRVARRGGARSGRG